MQRPSSRAAHPHSRGENNPKGSRKMKSSGSSPLTRGKLVVSCPLARTAGLIPTHAGKTTPTAARAPPDRTHPHSRGENAAWLDDLGVPGGSSPLTRGKPHRRPCRCSARGLIPTHAGKTTRLKAPATPGRAHPHSRGENIRQESNGYGNLGSSPLTRGKLFVLISSWSLLGLIPTHAGKTC